MCPKNNAICSKWYQKEICCSSMHIIHAGKIVNKREISVRIAARVYQHHRNCRRRHPLALKSYI
jgi:hypothetical protein